MNPGTSTPKDVAGLSEADQIRDLLDQLHAARAAIHAAHGLLAPLGNQVTPSVLAIREARAILRRVA